MPTDYETGSEGNFFPRRLAAPFTAGGSKVHPVNFTSSGSIPSDIESCRSQTPFINEDGKMAANLGIMEVLENMY